MAAVDSEVTGGQQKGVSRQHLPLRLLADLQACLDATDETLGPETGCGRLGYPGVFFWTYPSQSTRYCRPWPLQHTSDGVGRHAAKYSWSWWRGVEGGWFDV